MMSSDLLFLLPGPVRSPRRGIYTHGLTSLPASPLVWLKSRLPEPQNVNLFGHSVFKEVIKGL